MDIKIVGDDGQIVQDKPAQPLADPNGLDAPRNLLRNEVALLFDFTPNETNLNKRELDTLIEYAKTDTDDHSTEGIKWAIRNLEMRLGTPPISEKRINYLYRYAYLFLEERKIKAEREKFLRRTNDNN